MFSTGMMDLAQRKEQFAIAVVRAIAAAAGVSCYRLEVDDDSIDIGFAARSTGRPRLEAQLKCSERDLLHDDGLHFPLPRKNYDELRITDLDVPRILIVVLVPADVGQWMTFGADQLTLRRCAWWHSLEGDAPTVHNTQVMVTLPLTQRFDVTALQSLMRRAPGGRA